MLFNFTALGIDPNYFINVNSIIHITMFITLTLPALILNLLCLCVLPIAKNLNWKMGVVVANLFLAEIVRLIGSTVDYLGYNYRAHFRDSDEADIMCNVYTALQVVSFLANIAATTIFSIVVHYFVKYGIKKVKWYALLGFIGTSWTFAIIVGVLTATKVVHTGTFSEDGFCVCNLSMSCPATLIMPILILISNFISTPIVLALGIRTYYYAKNNTLEESTDVKKAVANTLMYHAIRLPFFILRFLLDEGFSLTRKPLEEHMGVIARLALEYVAEKLLIDILSLLTPIMSLVLLHCLRNALKRLYRKARCKAANTVHPHLNTIQAGTWNTLAIGALNIPSTRNQVMATAENQDMAMAENQDMAMGENQDMAIAENHVMMVEVTVEVHCSAMIGNQDTAENQDTAATKNQDAAATENKDTEATKNQDAAASENKDTEATKNQDAAATENQDAAATENQDAAATENQDAAATENQDTEATKNQDTAATENQNMAATENQDTAAIENQDMAATKNQDMATTKNQDATATDNQNMAAIDYQDMAATENQDVAPTDNQNMAAIENQDMAATKNQDATATNQNMAAIENQNMAAIENQNTAATENQDTAATDNQDTAATENQDTAATENQDTAATENQDTAATENQDTAATENQDTAATKNQDTAATENQDTAATENQDTAATDNQDTEVTVSQHCITFDCNHQ